MAASASRPEFSTIRFMKRPGLTPHLLAATLFLGSAAALSIRAQDIRPMNASGTAAQRAEDLLKRFDKNNDGKLDDDERADAKEAMMKEQVDRQMSRVSALPGGLEQFRTQALDMFDRNRDGRLDEDERLAAQKFADTYLAGAEDLNKRFDKNADGKIDPTERAAMDAYLGELRALGAGQMRTELLRRFDRNADGRVDENEMIELEKFVRPRVATSPDQLRRYDQDRNGTLDDAEWAVARSAITQWLNHSAPAALDNAVLRDEDPMQLRRVNEEVARRRAERERAAEMLPSTGEPKRTPEEEAARLKAVADEVARRRAIRDQANQPNGSAK
jgi:Ca2+-binding EF-hand superfamily protein